MVRGAFLAVVMLGLFSWGLAAGHYQIFPFSTVQSVIAQARPDTANSLNADYVMSDVPTLSGERYAQLNTKADVVMAGDSVTASGRWEEYFPDTSIINRGANGDQVGGLLDRIDQITRAEPKRVFLMIGVNDLANRNTNAQILERYEAIVRALQKEGIVVFVQSVLPCRDYKTGPCDARMRDQTMALNAQLDAIAKRMGARYIAVGEALSGPDGVLETYSLDGVHMSSAGFAKWAEMIAPHVRGEAQP